MHIREWVQRQNELNKRSRVLDSPTIRTENTGAGIRLHAVEKITDPGSGGSSDASTIIYKTTGGSTAAGYSVALYGNGRDQASTGTGTLEVCDMAWVSDLPVGTWGVAHALQITYTGGTE